MAEDLVGKAEVIVVDVLENLDRFLVVSSI